MRFPKRDYTGAATIVLLMLSWWNPLTWFFGEKNGQLPGQDIETHTTG